MSTMNPYVHLHTTFANPDMSSLGGHLLDAQTSIGAKIVLKLIANSQCAPGIDKCNVSTGCVFSEPITVNPFGTFYNWDKRFWYPIVEAEQSKL